VEDKNKLINDLLTAQAGREKAGRDNANQMRQEQARREAEQRDFAKGIQEGKTTIQRTVQTGKAEGSEAYHRPPENIVVGRRTDFDTNSNRPPQPMPGDKGNY
jgi:hypothetical protein